MEVALSENTSNMEEVRVEKSKGGITTSITVREIENGYIIRKNKYGRPEGSKDDNAWIDETKEFYTKNNPLAESEKSEVEGELSGLMNSLDGIL